MLLSRSKWTRTNQAAWIRGRLLFRRPLPGVGLSAIENRIDLNATALPAGLSASTDTPMLDFVLQYQLRHKLGEGGYSDVYAAWDTQLQRAVALKRLKHAMGSKGATPLDEARRSAALRHPAFVRIYGLAEEAQAQWIVMELVQGEELNLLLQRSGALPLTRALALLRQAAEALQEIHEVGLVHGDIKPANLMVEPDDKLRILDFGVAREYDALATQTLDNLAPLAGTLAYMAPETLLGNPTSPRSDLYALGVVFYEMLTGQRPHAGQGNLSVAILMQDSDSWAFTDATPDVYIQLIRTMTARDPLRRLTGMGELLRQLHVIETGATVATPIPIVAAPSPVTRRGSRGLMGAAAGLVLLAAGIGFGPQLTDAARALTTRIKTVTSPALTDQQEIAAGIQALQRVGQDGVLQLAIQHFQTVANRSPQHAGAPAWLALAWCYSYINDGHDEGLLRLAQASADRALQLDDQLAMSHVAHAWVLELQGKLDAALKENELALRLDPREFYALNGRAQVLSEMHRFDDAVRAVKDALKLYPDNWILTNNLGVMYFQHADYAAAEAQFRDSIQRHPDAVLAYANLNATLLRLNRPDEALQVLQKGLQICPAGRLYNNLGSSLYIKGDYVGATAAFEKAVSGEHGSPNNYLRWANLADARRWIPGQTAAANDGYRRALQLLQPLLSREPDNFTYRSRAALYAARMGDAAQANTLLRQLQGHPVTDADLAWRMALAYEITGAREPALALLQHAVQLKYPVALIESEPDFMSLRRDPRYQRLITPEAQPHV